MPIYIFLLFCGIIACSFFLNNSFEEKDYFHSVLFFILFLFLVCLETFMVLLQTGFISFK